jgi:hypothetical protein
VRGGVRREEVFEVGLVRVVLRLRRGGCRHGSEIDYTMIWLFVEVEVDAVGNNNKMMCFGIRSLKQVSLVSSEVCLTSEPRSQSSVI